jgi:glycosyltransferase involved in cell wall biosynthesis
MRNSWLVDFDDPLKNLPEDRVILLPPVPNEKLPQIYAQAHIGLFPNRCEAGTNLVMCEFMACGRPVIASYAHGHKDVLDILNSKSYLLTIGAYDAAGWFNCEVSDIINALEDAYARKERLIELGKDCAALTHDLTWEACAKKIVEAAFPI